MGSQGKKIKTKYRNNSGSTMVETLVSFTVLFIVLASLYSIVVFSMNLYMKSVDASRLNQKFYREIYKSTTDASTIKKTHYNAGFSTAPDGSQGAKLVFSIDTDKTNSKNYNDSRTETAYINMDNTGADTYVYTGSDADRMMVPKAVLFYNN